MPLGIVWNSGSYVLIYNALKTVSLNCEVKFRYSIGHYYELCLLLKESQLLATVYLAQKPYLCPWQGLPEELSVTFCAFDIPLQFCFTCKFCADVITPYNSLFQKITSLFFKTGRQNTRTETVFNGQKGVGFLKINVSFELLKPSHYII